MNSNFSCRICLFDISPCVGIKVCVRVCVCILMCLFRRRTHVVEQTGQMTRRHKSSSFYCRVHGLRLQYMCICMYICMFVCMCVCVSVPAVTFVWFVLPAQTHDAAPNAKRHRRNDAARQTGNIKCQTTIYFVNLRNVFA